MNARSLLAANWKMHLTLPQAQALASEVAGMAERELPPSLPLMLCVPAAYLYVCQHLTKRLPQLGIGGQNLSAEARGAYTGETSAEMLTSCGARAVLVGHSERRQLFQETGPVLRAKLQQALASGLSTIYCVGETAAERQADQTLQVIEGQLTDCLLGIPPEHFGSITIAYEPVWAIGTGLTPTAAQAQAVHGFIRGWLSGHFGARAERTSLLYGGSVKANNAASFFAEPDIDGGLVGGASLIAREFIEIAKALASAKPQR